MGLFTRTWGNYDGGSRRANTTIRYFSESSKFAHVESIGNNICSHTNVFEYAYAKDYVHFYHHNTGTNGFNYLALPNGTPDDTVVQFACDLLTPIVYNLSPITVKTLREINNIRSNANGNIEVSYWTH